MIESPLIQKIVLDSKREERVQNILVFLEGRFGAVTPTISAGLEQVKEMDRLARLMRQTGLCTSLQAFEKSVLEELPKRPPASTRGKRRPKKAGE